MAGSAEAGRGEPEPIETQVPQRMDRLPWSRFHTRVIVALGVTWMLDGLEVTFKGAVSGVLQDPETLGLSPAAIGGIASFYLTGAVLGALVFGWLTDRLGRKRMFFVTLAVYLVGVGLSALSWNWWSFALFRFITGLGIGGEYAAIGSAVDEFVPARLRGRLDLIVSGTYWLGAAIGSLSTLVLLDPRLFPVDLGWRVGFGVGALIGLTILLLRRMVPESPRWMVVHGYSDEAERTLAGIEEEVSRRRGRLPAPEGSQRVHPRRTFGFGLIVRTVLVRYRKRALVGLALMVSQAFLYNAVFFTYAMVLTRFYGVAPGSTGIYLLPFALGNFLGPVLLGRFFDTVGRKPMIAGTYLLSGVLMAVTGYLFTQELLTALWQTVAWTVIFFIASPAASAGYLTVGEIFPLETRALAIALFYAVGTATGGIVAPWLFGHLIGTGSRMQVLYGYLLAAGLMAGAALIELLLGVKAEQSSLEDVATPLATEAAGGRGEGGPAGGKGKA